MKHSFSENRACTMMLRAIDYIVNIFEILAKEAILFQSKKIVKYHYLSFTICYDTHDMLHFSQLEEPCQPMYFSDLKSVTFPDNLLYWDWARPVKTGKMFLWDWFTGALGYLGLWKKSGKLLFLGEALDFFRPYLLITNILSRVGQCGQNYPASYAQG